RVISARRRLQAAGRTDDEAARRLAALQDALQTAQGRYMQPMLVDQIQYLYRMLLGADQKPGRDAFIRYAELRAELDRILSELEATERLADATRRPAVPGVRPCTHGRTPPPPPKAAAPAPKGPPAAAGRCLPRRPKARRYPPREVRPPPRRR